MENTCIEFAHIIDDNIGDVICSPIHHFNFKNCEEKNFRDIKIEKGCPVIVGGGGMLHPGPDRWIFEISKLRNVILWGVGINYYDSIHENLQRLKKELLECKLVGLRDKNFSIENGFEYVPGPTCMYKEFDSPKEIIYDVGVYEHFQSPINLIEFPKMNNKVGKTLSDIVGFLSSCKKIITNSYHGAYWSRLLGRDVELFNVKSNRFSDMPTESLSECRKLNIKFYEKVKNALIR